MEKINERQPQVRFDEFDDEWTLTELSNVFSIPEKVSEVPETVDELLTVKLHMQGVTAGVARKTLKLGATKYFVRHAGQFIYGKQNFHNGSMGVVPAEYDGKLTSGMVPSLDVFSDKYDVEYLVNYLGRPVFYENAVAYASGTGSKLIQEKVLLSFKIPIPEKAEQTKIGLFFKHYSALKDAQETRVKLLKKIKQGLLQQMLLLFALVSLMRIGLRLS